MADINKIGLIVIRENKLLLCRKTGLGPLILPGGKVEKGESALDCLVREIHEELGDVTLVSPEYIGTYADRAASDPNLIVEIQLYKGDLAGEPAASAEIAEIVWFGPEDDRTQLAPSINNKILPDLIRRDILHWKS